MTSQDFRERLRQWLAGLGGQRLGDLGVGDLARGGWVGDLRATIAFYTTLPLAGATDGAALARAAWCAPLVGALIGLLSALGYWVGVRLNLPPLVAATLAVIVGLLVTGALHEDGLADTADGFGGGATRERILDIMRDSRIGTFGACALAMSFILRIGSLADLPNANHVAWALVGTHAAARGMLPLFMLMVPPARPDGLSATAGKPSLGGALTAALIGFVLLWLALGLRNALIALVPLVIGWLVMAWLTRRRIGGQTGDVLGALEQVGECLVLMVPAARF